MIDPSLKMNDIHNAFPQAEGELRFQWRPASDNASASVVRSECRRADEQENPTSRPVPGQIYPSSAIRKTIQSP